MKYYIIQSDEGYWSNVVGWVEDIEESTLFKKFERDTYGLPIGNNVRWIQIQRKQHFNVK